MQKVPNVCLAVANLYQGRNRREIRHCISPCMDFCILDHSHSLSYLQPRPCCRSALETNRKRVSHTNHATRFLEQDEDCGAEALEVCLAIALPCERRSKIRHRISSCMNQTCIPFQSRGTFPSQMQRKRVCKFTLMQSSTPSSEDDVLSQPAKSLTPSSVAVPEQSGNMYFSLIPVDEGVSYHHRITLPLFWSGHRGQAPH